MSKFKPDQFDNGNKPTVINLKRKHVLQMAEIVNKFPDQDEFELYIDDSTEETAIKFKFTLELGEQK